MQLARQAISDRGRFSVALSGGSTPGDLYALLATPELAAQVDWARVYFFWGDERAVPPDDPASNYRMAHETLVSRVPVPPENIFRIPAENEPSVAAREYDRVLRHFFTPPLLADGLGRPTGERRVGVPHFDLILLGLGANGHTASLFPHSAVLHNTSDWVAAEYIAEVKMNRITLTVPSINAARNILFLVSGADKAQTVHAVLRGDHRPADLPAQLIQSTDGTLVWLLDRAAASAL